MYLHAVTSWHIQNYIDYFKFGLLFFFFGIFYGSFQKNNFFKKNDGDGTKIFIYCGNKS